jgi:hypothetical protein
VWRVGWARVTGATVRTVPEVSELVPTSSIPEVSVYPTPRAFPKSLLSLYGVDDVSGMVYRV